MSENRAERCEEADGEPLVTAVICTYRRANLVTRALRSVQNQTYRNLEIIVVDDASPDCTQQVIAGVEDSRIRYIRHNENKGLPAARNTGIRAARGRYVAFLDDDDEWRPSKIEKQLRFLEKSSADAVLCASYVNNRQRRRFGRPQITSRELKRGNEFVPGSGLFGRAEALRAVWFDESIGYGEDWDLLIRLAERSPIGYLNEPLYNVNDGGHERMTNTAVNQTAESLEKRIGVVAKHREFFGPFWTKRHTAMVLLSYFWNRRGKATHLRYTIRRCGLLPVMSAFITKVVRRTVSAILSRQVKLRNETW